MPRSKLFFCRRLLLSIDVSCLISCCACLRFRQQRDFRYIESCCRDGHFPNVSVKHRLGSSGGLQRWTPTSMAIACASMQSEPCNSKPLPILHYNSSSQAIVLYRPLTRCAWKLSHSAEVELGNESSQHLLVIRRPRVCIRSRISSFDAC